MQDDASGSASAPPQLRPPGRPRGFDADRALEQAMRVFWAQGYEGASLDDLTAAMAINRTSMYRAFGNKEALFDAALARYTRGPASYVARALAQPTALQVATEHLHGAVRATTDPDAPRGCLGVQACLVAGGSGRPVRDALTTWREGGTEHLRDRLQRAADEGDLPVGADAGQLARYLMAVANGIAVQAAGGTSAEELHQVATTALLAWPTSPRA